MCAKNHADISDDIAEIFFDTNHAIKLKITWFLSLLFFFVASAATATASLLTNQFMLETWFISLESNYEQYHERERESEWDRVIYTIRTSTFWLILWLALTYEEYSQRVVEQSLIALYDASVVWQRKKIANADNNTHSAFSINWKIVKLFIASRKNVQKEFNVKFRNIVAENRKSERERGKFY
jgi:Na+/H+ antiporter NhaD/arsenite permease-like protein